MGYLCSFLWCLMVPRAFEDRGYVYLPFAGIVISLAMEGWGFPEAFQPLTTPVLWWVMCRALLGFSLCHMCASKQQSGTRCASWWLAVLDRLCFGVCVLHIRAV